MGFNDAKKEERMSLHTNFDLGTPLGANLTAASFDLTRLHGVWRGEVTNPILDPTLPPPEPYIVELDAEFQGEWEEWKEIGRFNYPTINMSAPALLYYPMNCAEHMAGENPTGQCFQMMENFRDESAVGYPADICFESPDGTEMCNYGDIFAYGFITLSVQTDGRLFYSYQNGVLLVTQTYLSPAVGGAPQPATTVGPTLSHESLWKESILPVLPGMKRLGSYWFRHGGKYTGTARHISSHIANPSLSEGDFEVEVEFPDSCGLLVYLLDPESLGLCGTISLAGESVGDFECGPEGFACGSASLISATVCLPHTICPDPAYNILGEGQCWQFFSNLRTTDPRYNMDTAWQTMSLQSDGSIYWGLQSGMLTTHEAFLVPY